MIIFQHSNKIFTTWLVKSYLSCLNALGIDLVKRSRLQFRTFRYIHMHVARLLLRLNMSNMFPRCDWRPSAHPRLVRLLGDAADQMEPLWRLRLLDACWEFGT